MLANHIYIQTDQVSTLAEDEAVYSSLKQTITSLHDKILILENALADKEKIIKLLEKQTEK
jgi:hypothetical protein